MNIDQFLRLLRHVQHNPSGGYTACCPAHDDHSPSLSISQGSSGRILVHCFAGCRPEAVVDALGLTMADLFPETSRYPSRATGPYFDAMRVVRELAGEIAVVVLIAEDLLNGTTMTPDIRDRLLLAGGRLSKALGLLEGA